jgi:molybdopterin/thiamine biosynthesis adenylyltransferase
MLVARLLTHNPNVHTGAITHLTAGRQAMHHVPPGVLRAFPDPVAGRWTRLTSFDPAHTPAQLWGHATALLTGAPTPAIGAVETDRAVWERAAQRWQLIGLLVDDTHTPARRADTWLFLVRHRPSPRHAWRTDLVQSAAAGATDVAVRQPHTTVLAHRVVVLVGVGALGSTIASELARAGLGRLHLIDGDVVDPATFCRQAGTLYTAGLPKTTAVAIELEQRTPNADLRAHPWRLGRTEMVGIHDKVTGLVADADLVIDATADPAASRYLAALSTATGTGFLHASATAGGHGGLIARIRPGTTAGCWGCLAHHRAEGTVPAPPADRHGTVWPARCTEPTFTGTGADLDTIATHAARLAIATLVGAQDGHEDFDGDVHVAALRDTTGRPIPATWDTQALTQHPACPLHPQEPGADDGPEAAHRQTPIAQPNR